MVDATLYYCWSCDAHRKVRPAAQGEAHCPRCGQSLGPDAQLATLAKQPRPETKHAQPRASAA